MAEQGHLDLLIVLKQAWQGPLKLVTREIQDYETDECVVLWDHPFQLVLRLQAMTTQNLGYNCMQSTEPSADGTAMCERNMT